MPLDMDLHRDNPNLHLHHGTPPPPQPHKPLPAEEEDDTKPRPLLSLPQPNGTLKKQARQEPPHPPSALPWPRRAAKSHVVYRECMKNHAAPLGGHALDGCGEFMPSPASNPSDPASLTCAACGCHRNFHRRILHRAEGAEGGALDEDDGDDEDHSGSPSRQGGTFNQYSASAPHMLMALSAGLHGGPIGPSGSPPVTAGTPPGLVARTLPAKRFRTRFSQEQKAGMQELCERLGWRMQRRDDAMVEQRCREMGISRGVFKVWMHNNKHAFVGGPSSRRGGGGGSAGGGEAAATGCNGGDGSAGGVCVNGDNGHGGGAGHAVNGCSVSS